MNRPSFTLDSELRIRRLHWAQTHEQTVLHTGLWAEDQTFTLSSDTWTDCPSHWTLSWGSDVYNELRHMNRPSFTLDSELRIRRLQWAQTHEQTILHTGLWAEDQTFTMSSDTWTDHPSHWTLSWGSDVYTELRHMNRPSFTLDSELRIRRLHWAQTHEQTVLHTGLWAEDQTFTMSSDTWTDRPSHWTLSWGSDAFTLSSDTWTDHPSHWTLSWGSDVYNELRHMNRPSFTLDSELRIRRLQWAQTHEQTVLHTGLWAEDQMRLQWAQTHEQTVLHTGLWAEDQTFTMSSDTWTDRPSHWTLSWGSERLHWAQTHEQIRPSHWTLSWGSDVYTELRHMNRPSFTLDSELRIRCVYTELRHMNRSSFTLDSELRIRCVYTELRHMNRPSFTLDFGLRIRCVHHLNIFTYSSIQSIWINTVRGQKDSLCLVF